MTRRYVAIAVGGALGATVRWAVAAAWNHGGSFPWSTFSTFAVETVDLVDARRVWLAFGYLATSVAPGFGVYVAAGVSTRRLRARSGPEAARGALALPLEEEP